MPSIRKLIGDPHPYRPYAYAMLMLAVGLSGGYWYGRQQLEKVIVDRNIQVDHTIIKDRIVTVTKTVHPDGTITESTTTQDKDTTADHAEERNVSVPTPKNDYSLGVRYRISSFQSVLTPGPQFIEAEIGRHLLGDIWLTAGGGLGGVTLGVRYDF